MFKNKRKQLKRLKEYYNNIINPKSEYPKGYIESKKAQLMVLEWLIAYYEGRAASTPKELLEEFINRSDYLNNNATNDEHHINYVYISMLYNWIYYNRITGF